MINTKIIKIAKRKSNSNPNSYTYTYRHSKCVSLSYTSTYRL